MKKMMRTTALGGALVFMAASAQAMDDGFMVGNTTFKLGGYVDLDVHMAEFSNGPDDANHISSDIYIPSTTPTTPNGESSENFDMTIETLRLSFTAMNGDTKGYIELDFWGRAGGADGNERVSSSFHPRIRRAVVESGNWLMGQEWTTFQNLSAIPESASFLTASDGQIFVRQPMVRWTNGPLQIALENPGESRIGGTAAENAFDRAERPDIVVRYNYKAGFGNISASLLSRQISNGLEGDAGFDEDGVSFNVAGRVKAGPGDVRFSYSNGEGIWAVISVCMLLLKLAISMAIWNCWKAPAMCWPIACRLAILAVASISAPVRWKSIKWMQVWKRSHQTTSLICGARNRSSLMASNI